MRENSNFWFTVYVPSNIFVCDLHELAGQCQHAVSVNIVRITEPLFVMIM